MLFALIQMNVEEKNYQGNCQHGLELLHSVCDATDIAILPEVWTTGYSLGALKKEAEEEGSKLLGQVSAISKAKNMGIVAGSVPFRRKDNKVYNTTFVFDKTGEIIAEYDKIHMFSLYNEEKYFKAGSKRAQFQFAGMSAGLSICYDVRFPELYRAMALQGVQLVFMPCEWPEVRGDAYRLLTQARAVESQLYMCAVNCVGKFRNDRFYGHSMLVSPTGEIIVEGGSEESTLYAEIDIQLVEQVRSTMSVLKDVREELYKA